MNREIIALSPSAEVSMADEWFEIADTNHFWMQWRFAVLERGLRKVASAEEWDGRFLEIGCGHGQFILQAQEKLNLLVDGCDLNTYALKKISGTRGQVYVYNIFDRQQQMIGKYKGVFLLDVIEHIDDDGGFLRVSLQHAAPRGLVVVNVPALSSLFSAYDVAAGHKRRYSKKDLVALLRACNVEPLYVGYWGFLLLPVALLRKFFLRFIPKNKVIEKGFSPQSSVVNGLFKILMKVELLLFRSAPLGSSVMAVGRKLS